MLCVYFCYFFIIITFRFSFAYFYVKFLIKCVGYAVSWLAFLILCMVLLNVMYVVCITFVYHVLHNLYVVFIFSWDDYSYKTFTLWHIHISNMRWLTARACDLNMLYNKDVNFNEQWTYTICDFLMNSVFLKKKNIYIFKRLTYVFDCAKHSLFWYCVNIYMALWCLSLYYIAPNNLY